MRSPRRCLEQLYLLGHEQRAELRGEAFDEILVREHSGPMRSTVGVIIEFPKMQKLIDRPGIALEIPDKLFILLTLLERREADLLVRASPPLPSCRHAACRFSVRRAPLPVPFHSCQSLEALIICHDSAVVPDFRHRADGRGVNFSSVIYSTTTNPRIVMRKQFLH
jgi:hypothetical protein